MPDTAPDVLILAAHPIELVPFAELIAQTTIGSRIETASVGVGMAAAGVGAMAALARARPRLAVLVGSYGAYPHAGSFSPARLLIPRALVALDASVLAGQAALPAPMAIRAEPDARVNAQLRALDPGADGGSLATTLAITIDDELAARLGRDGGCVGENLEALSVGLACAHSGVPYACVMACTNVVGSQGRAQWRSNHPAAALATACLLQRWLERGPD